MNPPFTKSRFEEDLKTFLKARRLRFLMGALGGLVNTYGVIYRSRWGVKEADRIAVAEWIKVQRIRGTVSLGNLEEDSADVDLLRETTAWVFDVNNLTQEDRQAAAAYKREVNKFIRKSTKAS